MAGLKIMIMDAASLIQFLITGLTLGSIYGLTALGFTIILNTTGVINFAQGEFVMLGGMMSVVFMTVFGLGQGLAIVLAIGGTTLVGALVERLALRPVRNFPAINLVIITIGVSILIRGLVMFFWGKDTHVLPPFSGHKPVLFMGAAIMPQALWILGISSFLLVAFKFFFSKTLYGKAMLACSFDPKAASLVGIGVQGMVLFSFMISAFVGAVGGVILAPLTMTAYDVGVLLGLKGFAACVLGGLGNPFGAAAGGIIIGVLEALGAGFISSAYKDALAFVILLALLFYKPSGLFGPQKSHRV